MLTPLAALERLGAHYGPRPWYSRDEPLKELIQTILAQHTSDLNAERAFGELWGYFGRWSAIAAAEVDVIADVIRTGGLARQKAPRIKGVLQEIHARRGEYDLAFLRTLNLADALEWLTTLNGVGPKTARCVLSFSLGFPCIPVDTHVHRVAKRLGLIGPKTTAEAAHAVLEAAIPPDDAYRFHVYFIEHGRGVCDAQRPRCAACPLRTDCPSSKVVPLAKRGNAAGRRQSAKVGRNKAAEALELRERRFKASPEVLAAETDGRS